MKSLCREIFASAKTPFGLKNIQKNALLAQTLNVKHAIMLHNIAVKYIKTLFKRLYYFTTFLYTNISICCNYNHHI